jgi:serine/threonine-protein kinase GIN4
MSSFVVADVEVAKPEEPRRLSAMIDSSVFIASPRARSAEILRTPKITVTTEEVFDDLSGSPFHVQPYPMRPRDPDAAPLPDTPTRIHAETVYDRFLMSTSAVKRVGSGYQSSAPAPSGSLLPDARAQRRSSRIFTSTRKPMLPAVSSEDVHRAASVDELGSIGRANMLSPAPSTEEPGVWRALKAATTRRISRVF